MWAEIRRQESSLRKEAEEHRKERERQTRDLAKTAAETERLKKALAEAESRGAEIQRRIADADKAEAAALAKAVDLLNEASKRSLIPPSKVLPATVIFNEILPFACFSTILSFSITCKESLGACELLAQRKYRSMLESREEYRGAGAAWPLENTLPGHASCCFKFHASNPLPASEDDIMGEIKWMSYPKPLPWKAMLWIVSYHDIASLVDYGSVYGIALLAAISRVINKGRHSTTGALITEILTRWNGTKGVKDWSDLSFGRGDVEVIKITKASLGRLLEKMLAPKPVGRRRDELVLRDSLRPLVRMKLKYDEPVGGRSEEELKRLIKASHQTQLGDHRERVREISEDLERLLEEQRKSALAWA